MLKSLDTWLKRIEEGIMRIAFLALIRRAIDEWNADQAARWAASLAYYALFSISPFLLIVVIGAGQFLGQDDIKDVIITRAEEWVGQEGANAVTTMLSGVEDTASTRLAVLASLFTLVIGASGLFRALRDALNRVWKIQIRPGQGVMITIRARIISYGVVVVLEMLILTSLILNTIFVTSNSLIREHLETSPVASQSVNALGSFVLLTTLCALVYKLVPDVKIAWQDVFLGASVTAILAMIGNFFIGLYIRTTGVASVYGAAGSLVALLIWIYYIMQIFLFGAELTWVFANTYGSRIRPADYSTYMTSPTIVPTNPNPQSVFELDQSQRNRQG